MSKKSSSLNILPCFDSSEIAKLRQSELNISRPIAISLGLSSVNACNVGYYTNRLGQKVEMSHLVKDARANKKAFHQILCSQTLKTKNILKQMFRFVTKQLYLHHIILLKRAFAQLL